MRRALADVLEPPPAPRDQARLRTHFGHCCAYCGAPAGPRAGHIDHAESGGGSGVGNLLLACGTCNGDEKREMGWEAFLRLKCGSSDLFGERMERIVGWQTANPRTSRRTTPEIEDARQEAEVAIAAFASAYDKLRVAVRSAAAQ